MSVLTLCAVLAACLLGSVLYMGRRATRKVMVQTVEQTTLNDSLTEDGIRVVHLSDLHVERLNIDFQTLESKIKNLRPDIIALTGDYCERVDSIPTFLTCIDQLTQIVPAGLIYVVFGNHDHYLGHHLETLRLQLEQRGCIVLSNESTSTVIRGQKINLIGIDDYCLRFHDISSSFANVPEDGYNLVLAHDPDTMLIVDDHHRVDFMLSGHLHGIQIRFPLSHRVYPLGTLMKNKVYRGYHEINGRPLYISRGLSQSSLNIRLRSKPEITLHQLRRQLVKTA